MAARRVKTPPYEAMRSAPRSTPGQAAPAPSRPAAESTGGYGNDYGAHASHPGADEAGESPGWSWAGVGVPIILRVPRGVAVLIAVGLIGLLVLAYWVGYTRGGNAEAERMRQASQENPAAVAGRDAPAAPPRSASATGDDLGPDYGQPLRPGAVGLDAVDSGSGGTNADRSTRSASGDPREPGRNYLVIARYPPDEAQRLAEFLDGLGVETVLEMEDNERFVRVWAVDQGFAAGELSSSAYQSYQAELRDAGRAWRRHNDGQGDAFETMYPRQYRGE